MHFKMGGTLVKINFASLLKRGLLQKERIGLEVSSFLLEQTPFQKGICVLALNWLLLRISSFLSE